MRYDDGYIQFTLPRAGVVQRGDAGYYQIGFGTQGGVYLRCEPSEMEATRHQELIDSFAPVHCRVRATARGKMIGPWSVSERIIEGITPAGKVLAGIDWYAILVSGKNKILFQYTGKLKDAEVAQWEGFLASIRLTDGAPALLPSQPDILTGKMLPSAPDGFCLSMITSLETYTGTRAVSIGGGPPVWEGICAAIRSLREGLGESLMLVGTRGEVMAITRVDDRLTAQICYDPEGAGYALVTSEGGDPAMSDVLLAARTYVRSGAMDRSLFWVAVT